MHEITEPEIGKCSDLSEKPDYSLYLQSHSRGPAKLLLNQSVIWVSTTHTFWARNMMDGEFFVLKAEDYLSHLIHTNHLIASNIHWLPEVRFCQSIYTWNHEWNQFIHNIFQQSYYLKMLNSSRISTSYSSLLWKTTDGIENNIKCFLACLIDHSYVISTSPKSKGRIASSFVCVCVGLGVGVDMVNLFEALSLNVWGTWRCDHCATEILCNLYVP